MKKMVLLAVIFAIAVMADSSVAAPSATSTAGGEAAAMSGRIAVDINTTTVEALMEVPGIGPALAQRIVNYRHQAGSLASLDELLAVKGIGEKNLARFRGYLTVNIPPATSSASPGIPR